MLVSFEEGRRFFEFDDQTIKYSVDVVKGTNPNGGEAVVIVRPAFEDWSITLEVEIDESTGVTGWVGVGPVCTTSRPLMTALSALPLVRVTITWPLFGATML